MDLKIVFIENTPSEATSLKRALDGLMVPGSYLVVWPGFPMHGMRTDRVTLTVDVLETLLNPEGDPESEMRYAWWSTQMQTRLAPGGKVIVR